MIPLQYNLRSLRVRKTTTIATASGIALVVFVFSAAFMLSHGIERTMSRSGSPDIAIVVRAGSEAELSSGIEQSSLGIIFSAPEVAHNAAGNPQAVGEVVGVLALNKIGTDGISNAQIRGVPSDVFEFRGDAHVVRGRMPTPGADEALVGSAIAGRFAGLTIGQSFEVRKNRSLQVVGVFEAAGSAYESEIWADVETVRSAFGRVASVSSARVRLRSPSDFDAFESALESNRQLQVSVMLEQEFYVKQSEGMSTFIRVIGMLVAFFFSLAAMIGAMITMYSSVATRSREIGTLRALGFKRWEILASFLFESLVLAVVGGTIGALLSLLLGLVRFPLVNFASWSEIVFTFEPTPQILGSALVFASVMGIVGGLLPAARAARVDVLAALRGAV